MIEIHPYREKMTMVVQVPHSSGLTSEEFYDFCQTNPDWRIERTAQGDIILMPPAGGETGAKNLNLALQVGNWAEQDGTGVAFDSSTGFDLPNGATRSPDVAWVLRSRLATLTAEQKQRFLPLCPDFVVELRSPSDALAPLRDKMAEYIANGARLGWLIDTRQRHVYVYRPGVPSERLDQPTQLAGDPVLQGFVLNLAPIWEARF